MICFLTEPLTPLLMVRTQLLEVPRNSEELTGSLPQDKLVLFHDWE